MPHIQKTASATRANPRLGGSGNMPSASRCFRPGVLGENKHINFDKNELFAMSNIQAKIDAATILQAASQTGKRCSFVAFAARALIACPKWPSEWRHWQRCTLDAGQRRSARLFHLQATTSALTSAASLCANRLVSEKKDYQLHDFLKQEFYRAENLFRHNQKKKLSAKRATSLQVNSYRCRQFAVECMHYLNHYWNAPSRPQTSFNKNGTYVKTLVRYNKLCTRPGGAQTRRPTSFTPPRESAPIVRVGLHA